jgi:hypothetical protein
MNNPGKQAGKSITYRNRLGSNQNKKHILSGKILKTGSTTRQKASLNSSRTFDPEVENETDLNS